MKNVQKGFIIPLIVALVALAIVGGAYFLQYRNQVSQANNEAVTSRVLKNERTETSKVLASPTHPVGTLQGKSATTTSLSESLSSEATNIRDRNFELLTKPNSFNFKEALDIANYVGGITKVRSAFLLAILQEELSLEKSDLCYLTNLKTGEGIRASDRKNRPKTMNPTRDVPYFLDITKKLGKDPLSTLVTCPMSFGWGGAMGPADFIPSTWALYKSRIEKITGKKANPWDTQDAFLAAGLFLSDTGAASQTYKGEWRAAMVYFSGSPHSGYNWYADGALTIAKKIQVDIDTIEKNTH